jgi:hypothetical protein
MEIESRLPFVGPPGPRDGRTDLEKRNYWIDEPTDDRLADYQRGKDYARMTIDAIQERNAEHDGIVRTKATARPALRGGPQGQTRPRGQERGLFVVIVRPAL